MRKIKKFQKERIGRLNHLKTKAEVARFYQMWHFGCRLPNGNRILPNFCIEHQTHLDIIGIANLPIKTSAVPSNYMAIFVISRGDTQMVYFQFSDLNGRQIGDYLYFPIDLSIDPYSKNRIHYYNPRATCHTGKSGEVHILVMWESH